MSLANINYDLRIGLLSQPMFGAWPKTDLSTSPVLLGNGFMKMVVGNFFSCSGWHADRHFTPSAKAPRSITFLTSAPTNAVIAVNGFRSRSARSLRTAKSSFASGGWQSGLSLRTKKVSPALSSPRILALLRKPNGSCSTAFAMPPKPSHLIARLKVKLKRMKHSSVARKRASIVRSALEARTTVRVSNRSWYPRAWWRPCYWHGFQSARQQHPRCYR